MRRPAIVAALALGCAHRPIEPPPAVDWPAGKEFNAYLAADERRALSIDQPGGGLRVTCGITGEGSYARVDIRRGAEVLAKGSCGDKIDVRDLPPGPVTVVLLVIGGAGNLHLNALPLGAESMPPQGDPPESDLLSAMKRRNVNDLDALLMDDFAYTPPDGLPVDKRAFLDSFPDMDPFKIREGQIRAHGDAATVTLVLEREGVPAISVTDTWVRDGARWRLLARQASSIKH